MAASWTVSFDRELSAQTVSFVQNFSITGHNNPTPLSFSQFNPSLGTLTGITLSFTGTASGSFSVTDVDPFAQTSVNTLTGRMLVIFPSLASGTFQQNPANTLTSNVSPALPYVITTQGGTANFTLASSTLNGMTDEDVYNQVTSGNANAYFVGTGTVTPDILQSLSLDFTAGDPPTRDLSGVTTPGVATLTYVYTVPEPSSVALAAVGVGFAAVLAKRRRK